MIVEFDKFLDNSPEGMNKITERQRMADCENVKQVTQDLDGWLGKMPFIPNTEYVTVNADGIFVGGKPATHYLGYEIFSQEYVKKTFKEIQNKFSDLQEIHVLASSNRGYRPPIRLKDIPDLMPCELRPDQKHGNEAWCRIKLNDGTEGIWAYRSGYANLELCATTCVQDIIKALTIEVSDLARFVLAIATRSKTKRSVPNKPNTKSETRPEKELKQTLKNTDSSVLDTKTVIQQETALKQTLKNMDLSALAGKTIEFDGYKIMIKKINQAKGR